MIIQKEEVLKDGWYSGVINSAEVQGENVVFTVGINGGHEFRVRKSKRYCEGSDLDKVAKEILGEGPASLDTDAFVGKPCVIRIGLYNQGRSRDGYRDNMAYAIHGPAYDTVRNDL